MNVQVIQVPYDSGHRSLRMGRGPEHFVANGLAEALEADGHEVGIETIESQSEFRGEVQTQFELYRSLAGQVAAARQSGHFPLILSGNCGASVGAIAGAGTERLGVIWFDAHGEFNTPETTASGFLDGMGLAIATGLCWKTLAASIPGFRPLPGPQILLVGGRDFDPGEREQLEQAGVRVIDAASVAQANMKQALQSAITDLQRSVDEIHLHIDLDSLNPMEAPANGFVTEDGGLSVSDLSEAITRIQEDLRITSLTVASFDPTYDPQGKTLRAALKLIRQAIAG